MPPKVTDVQPSADNSHVLEEETARAARRIVATYSEDFLDGVTLMSMLGVEPKGLIHRKVLAEHEEAQPKKATRKKATKKATKKSTKKTTKAAKKTSKKAAKKTAKKS